jgi:IPT/TIG domain
MADFSRTPQDDLDAALKNGYIGIYFEQGVPILDRDLNLLQSLVAENVRSIVRSYIGDGVPAEGAGFEIKALPADNDFLISAGKCLVDGIELTLKDALKYSGQQPPPRQLTKPTAPRQDTVYLDLTLQTVESGDDTLANPDDVGMRTSVRVKRVWTVRVAEGGPPQAEAGHLHYPLARLSRTADTAQIKQEMIVDLRQTRLSLDAVETRMQEVERLRVQPSLRSGLEFDPPAGNAGLEVRIFGRNLDLFPVKVSFDDKPAKEPTNVSTNMIVVKVPPEHPGGDAFILVTTAKGDVKSTKKFKVLTEAPGFLAPPDDLRPPSALEGATVTLRGTNLDIGTLKVTFGTVEAREIVERHSDMLGVKVPPGLGSDAVSVTVQTSGGTKSATTKFTRAFPPAFASPPFDQPSHVTGQQVKLNGQHFGGVVAVQFKQRNAPSPVVQVNPPFTSVSDTQITVAVPPGVAGPCTVIVITSGGQASSPSDLTVLTS